MENSFRCEICKTNVHRASFASYLGIKKHLANKKQDDINIPEWFFKEEQTPIKKKVKKEYNPKTLKKIAKKSYQIR